jgi:hypothetical protein
MRRPDIFLTAFTEKLLTFALGRGVDHEDGPAVREIVRDARKEQDRLSAVVVGIVKSIPFRLRRAP